MKKIKNDVTVSIFLVILIIVTTMSVTFAYFTNKKYVFMQKEKSIREALTFYLSRLSTLLLDMLLMFILVTKLNMNDKICKLIIQIIIIILNYILSKLLVFKKTRF